MSFPPSRHLPTAGTRTLAAVLLGGALALSPSPAAAVPKPPLLQISAGLGAAYADTSSRARASGLYAAGEYVLRPTTWLTPRAYAGVLVAQPGGDCGAGVAPCEVSSRIVFLGAKVRLMAPIPYVGPFLELGLGASVGRISTRVGTVVDAGTSGVTYHVPWSVGLALGERHQYELSFLYLVHPRERQTGGGIAIGFSFPLG